MIERIYRVVRGGSWGIVDCWLRSSYRSMDDPDFGSRLDGFRLVVRIKDE